MAIIIPMRVRDEDLENDVPVLSEVCFHEYTIVGAAAGIKRCYW